MTEFVTIFLQVDRNFNQIDLHGQTDRLTDCAKKRENVKLAEKSANIGVVIKKVGQMRRTRPFLVGFIMEGELLERSVGGQA